MGGFLGTVLMFIFKNKYGKVGVNVVVKSLSKKKVENELSCVYLRVIGRS
jgi:hypothetical protein